MPSDRPFCPEAFKAKVQRKLRAARKRKRRRRPLSPPPRYDEVYFKGTAWLDRQ